MKSGRRIAAIIIGLMGIIMILIGFFFHNDFVYWLGYWFFTICLVEAFLYFLTFGESGKD